MINLVEKINKEFNNKYNYLKFLNVVYEKDNSLCILTFLYPYDMESISEDDQRNIEQYIQKLFSINGKIKIKFKKSYLDEKLVLNEVIEFFKVNKKGIFPYISLENLKSRNEGRDVFVEINLNQDILALVDETELKMELTDWLKKLFVANISVLIKENEERLPDEIDCDDILPVTKRTRRYKVQIEEKLIGNDIVPEPEYIGDIKDKKILVILSGVVKNKNKKTFTLKKGKRAGQEKSFYTFSLADESGEIECVYFCPKAHENHLENLQEKTMILCVGDIRVGLSGKLTYYIKKISLASPFKEEVFVVENAKIKHKKVAEIERISSSAQENIFEQKPEYNELIKSNKIVVFDLETTGLDPETCEITEFGGVKIEYGQITERFSSFVSIKGTIPQEVKEKTHITEDMLIGAPQVSDVLLDFYDWCEGCIISGYNVINFDMKFIKKAAKDIGVEFNNEVVDTINVVRRSPLRTPNYKLGTVVKMLGLELKDAHRAYNDAYATAQVLLELCRVDKNF